VSLSRRPLPRPPAQSNPGGDATPIGSIPVGWVTNYSGDMGNTFGPKGFVVHESDEPDVLVDLPHAHLLSREDLAQIDLASLEANASAVGHRAGPIVERVVELAEATRSGSSSRRFEPRLRPIR
jgi:hypothetical protein